MTRHFLLPYTNEVPFIMRMSLFWTKIAAAASITQCYIQVTYIPYFFITYSLPSFEDYFCVANRLGKIQIKLESM